MERILKDFACVTTGDIIKVNHENQSYYHNIVETWPRKAVSLIETDCELQFTKTADHEETGKLKPEVEQAEDAKSSEKDASRRLDKDEDELVVSYIKYSKSLDGSCENRENQRRQREDMRQH